MKALDLIERDDEVAAIEAAIAAVEQAGQVTLIEGAAGAGKTRLLEEGTRRARAHGIPIVDARGMLLEREFPFGVVVQLFHGLMAPGSRRDRWLSGAARLAAPIVCPELGPEQVVEPSFGVLHGLFWLVSNIAADAPLLLVVDDLHWADSASLRFIGYLARRTPDLPLVMLLASRTGEPGADLSPLADVRANPDTRLLQARPLSLRGTGILLERDLGSVPDPLLVEGCHAATAGNPFYVRELAAALRHDGLPPDADAARAVGRHAPPSVMNSVLLRLGQLDPSATLVSRAVAILGEEVEFPDAAAVARVDLETVSECADVLMKASILESRPLLTFVHPLVRAAVLDDMSPAERGAWHRRAARVLAARGAGEEQVAGQLLLSHPANDAEAARRLHAAGLSALAKGSPTTAVEYLRRGLSEPPAPDAFGDVLADLGTAELMVDDPAAAIEHLEKARSLATDAPTRADRTVRLWQGLLAVGRIHDGMALIDRTIAELGDEDREARLGLQSDLFTVGMFVGTEVQWIWEQLDRFVDLPADTPSARRLVANVSFASVYRVRGAHDELVALAHRAIGAGELVEENLLDPVKWAWAVVVLILADEVNAAERWLALAEGASARLGAIDGVLCVHVVRSLLHIRCGRLSAAEADATFVLELTPTIPPTPLRGLFNLAMLRMLCTVFTERGHPEKADVYLAEHQLQGDLGDGHQHIKLYRERGYLRLAQGRVEEALADALAQGDAEHRLGITDPSEAPWRPLAAEAYARTGRLAEAIALAEENIEISRRWALPRDLGIALRTRGLVEPALDQRVAFLREAVRELEASPARLELARACAELGIALVRWGKRREGRAVLESALDTAARLGADALAERVRDELKVAGARPRRHMFSGIEGLTASERRIAELAATGLTNREIAQALFVTSKTVESHLTSIYRKLDVSARTQLAAALSRALGA